MRQQELLFVGFSYDKTGPHFIFEDIQTRTREKMYFDSKVITIENTESRYCIGTYDLSTFATSPCKAKVSLEPKYKGNHCNNCQFEIGFNPAFYNAKVISPQQERYNASPHVVYMAYFSSNHIKVGIASERRHSIRLLEQGARAAVILAKYPNAQLAREVETQLCSNVDILENLTSDTKLRLLIDEDYKFDVAIEHLMNAIKKCYNQPTVGNPIDLEPYYFYGRTLERKIQRLNNQKDAQVSGLLCGMIGDLVIISQPNISKNVLFAVSIKKYVSHIVKIYPDEVRFSYTFEPKQLTIWDML
jgi:hypothetical protein